MSEVYKGMMVFYYPTGEIRYSNAHPAIVMDHSPCGLVATLKVLRLGTDVTKQLIKRFDHHSLVEQPHHAREQGVWGPVVPLQTDEPPKSKGTSRTLTDKIIQMGRDGMNPSAIVGKLKNEGVSLDDVTRILSKQ